MNIFTSDTHYVYEIDSLYVALDDYGFVDHTYDVASDEMAMSGKYEPSMFAKLAFPIDIDFEMTQEEAEWWRDWIHNQIRIYDRLDSLPDDVRESLGHIDWHDLEVMQNEYLNALGMKWDEGVMTKVNYATKLSEYEFDGRHHDVYMTRFGYVCYDGEDVEYLTEEDIVGMIGEEFTQA